MNDLITLAILVCITVTMVTAGYFIGLACSWWDHRRAVRRYHKQRKG